MVLAGELDIAGLDTFRAALSRALVESRETVRIDAAQLSFIDSIAISELLRYQLLATVRQRWIRIEQVSRPVARVLDLLDLRQILMDH